MADEQCRQWTRQRFSSVVLERVDDGPKRARVGADRAALCKLMRVPPASWTLTAIRADDPPRRQRVAAHVAERRSERRDRLPARSAHRASSRLVERPFTCGTGRGENDREERVSDASNNRGTGEHADSFLTLRWLVRSRRLIERLVRLVFGYLNPLGIAPQTLERIKRPRLRREDVDDEREVVHQDPLGAVVPFDV